MSRWFFPWSSSIKKRACRYLLQHYLGHFFEERLSLDQLSLDLYNGSGSVRDIHLDIWSVNELLDSMSAPLEIIDGFVGSISVTIPWSALVTENCTVEITGLQVTCRPKYRTAHGPEFQSWSSMTTSMQLAQECLKEQPEEPSEPTQPLEGLEMFAQTIETVLRRIKVTFIDTIIRLEHVPDGSRHGVALEVHIKRLEYCDEAVKDSSHLIPVDIHQPPAFIHKILQLSGVNLYYEEFLNRSCTPPDSYVPQEMDSSFSSVGSRTFTESHSRTVEPASSPLLQIGTCTGYIEMTVKLKQNEAFPGPKLEFDGKLGSLHLLLTPKQISYLQDLLDAVSTSEVNNLKEKMIKGRPIVSEDMKLIEQDLSNQLHSGQSFNQSLDERPESSLSTENGDMFYSMNPLTSSVTSIRSASELSDDLDTSVISEYNSCQLQPPSLATGLIVNSPRRFGNFPFAATLPHPQNLSKRPGKTSHTPLVETVKLEMLLKVTLGGVTLTVLQHDPESILSDSSDSCLNPSLCRTAQHFFTELGYFKDTAFSEQDFNHLRPKFEKACFQSNLRLTGAAVQIVCEQKASTSVQIRNVDLCFRMVEILECLCTKTTVAGMQQKMKYTEILMFKNPSAFICASPPRPCAQIHYKWTQRSGSKISQKKPSVAQNAEVFIEFMEFHSEVDLGIMDRMSSLLSLFLIGTNELNMKMSYEQHSVPNFSQSCIDPLSLTEQQVKVQVSSPKANFRLLFPIPDLRPEPECRPWKEKAVRGEYLTLEFTDIDFKTEFNSAAKTEPVKLEAVFSDLHGVYKDGEKPAVSCIRACKVLDPLCKVTGKKYIFPKIVVIINPDSTGLIWDLIMEKMDDVDPCTVESPCELKQPDASPFSSKRTMYETEEMVIPGDAEEMAEFKKKTLAMSQYVLDVTLPSAHVFLPSKEFYESIYNRINNDLLMWEPRVPPSGKSKTPSGVPVPGHPLFNTTSGSVYKQDNFRMCKSAFRLDSDSEDEDHQFDIAEVVAQKRKAEQRAHSFLSAVVNIKKGRLTLIADAKNETGKKLEDSHGELVLDIENGTVFSVSQFKGQVDLSYLCIESDKVALYHKAVLEDYLLPEKLEVPNSTPPENLNPIIYCSEDGVMAKLSAGRKDRSPNMLSVTIKISLDTKKNIKEFLVALRLQAATVRHHMALTNQSWHAQLIDFLDVIDDPILGYIPPTVITVLHTHLFCCALDYRPLYLPVRVVITVETFTLSSNIIVDTSTFHLRFILDDSAVYLSDKCEAEIVELRKDYVCVLDVDLLKLVVTTWKGSSHGKLTQPLFELRCSNNVVHLHTCADSCAMLINLIQYVVNSGDLHPPPKQESPTEIAGQKLQLSESPASLPACLPAETAEINQGDLADALMDSDRNFKDLSFGSGEMILLRQNSPVSVYLFPGENRTAERRHAEPLNSGATMDGLDSFPSDGSEVESDSTDNDDFCILDAPGMGIPAKDGEPSVTRLVDGPISVKDGHFSRPLGSTDLLKAPVRFPMPETRIMLREISVVWHLYGGKDFGVTRSSSAHSPRIRSGSASARSSPSRTSVTNRPQNTWRTQGGTGRVHDILMEIQLTKVSFQHEAYPTSNAVVEKELAENSGPEVVEQPVARQVFIVQELEIRDRLASSQINKFLYLYTSEKMPRRAHSNMLTIKALHVHPESGLGGQECYLRVSLMPLRLNIDQDALFFLKDFFTSLATGINPVVPVEVGTDALKSDVSQRSSLSLDPEVTNKEMEPGQSLSAKGQDISASMDTTISENSSSSTASSSTDQPIFFREFRFTSEVPIWLDYQGKHMTVDQVGTFAGIMIGLAQLNCSELKLKRLCCRHGLLGVDKVVNYALNEWLSDIKKNQLPGILGGVGPMHSVVQLFHGVRDLFWMPIEQYRKDGRIIRGIQRGAASFGTSTASAALELSNRLVQAIQATAETVYDIVSPTPPITRAVMDKRHSRRHQRAQQPADLREGVVKAYDTVREGVIDTAQTICDVATRGHEQKGITGAVGGVLRQIPPTVVKPLIVATEATSNLLGGMRNQIKPDARKEDFLKWRLDEIQE
ncbi:autophagy-related protein 2 homolog A [Protopterus annectens]|uniref:autophagy-related protein 2 homolog A n=1 Tax=Protopterus annectens TaxID=7888 RepID=UPI001CFC0DA4|nr:autophagy-related protein 2 homolog A [Protopterus annectens]